ncbi:MAG TPA: methyltransferase domain-containing protein [Bosea sp. (in: a-proteobacteria)]|jgi:SAM-dependent methyltransferase|uniref:class I SAM-dependent methyltransferase n=1 Tax=Bosea sp. (in: a-proteobacteria) TaxID=1871050 RepID=UPI002E0D76DC|nr:methyltransferase domain-containing protein [Bosea sp. (in: a-proteobacteria)]
MHASAQDKARIFRQAYLADVEATPLTLLDVGSAIVDGQSLSNRDVLQNPGWTLRGMDIEPGLNVDVAVADPYHWSEIESGSVDVVTCSEVFEHAEFFWITILEIARVLKGNGLAFITSPGGGPRHRFPVDCWRFYDDAFPALARYAGLNLLEAQVQWVPAYRKGIQWRDSSAVMQKPVRDLAGARLDAARGAIGRSLRGAEPALDEIDLSRFPQEPCPTSPIPVQSGKNAFAAREAELLAGSSVALRKARLVLRQLREIRRIIATPIRDLHL